MSEVTSVTMEKHEGGNSGVELGVSQVTLES